MRNPWLKKNPALSLFLSAAVCLDWCCPWLCEQRSEAADHRCNKSDVTSEEEAPPFILARRFPDRPAASNECRDQLVYHVIPAGEARPGHAARTVP